MTEITKERAETRWTIHPGDMEQVAPIEPKHGVKLFVSQKPNSDNLIIRRRAEGEGGMIGDSVNELSPGQSVYGVTYDQLFNNLGEVTV